MRFKPPSRFLEFVQNNFPAKTLSLILKVLDCYNVTAGCEFEANKSALITTVATVWSSMLMVPQQEH